MYTNCPMPNNTVQSHLEFERKSKFGQEQISTLILKLLLCQHAISTAIPFSCQDFNVLVYVILAREHIFLESSEHVAIKCNIFKNPIFVVLLN